MMNSIDDELTKAFSEAEKNPDSAKAHSTLGRALRARGKIDEALHALRLALQIDPELVNARVDMGHTFRNLGQLDEAEACYLHALQLEPENIRAYFGLCHVKTCSIDDPHWAMLEANPEWGEKLPLQSRILYWFALAKMREDVEQYDEAFAAYQNGNRLKYEQLTYDETSDEALVSYMMSVFSRKFLAERLNRGYADRAPIFIVGMPRSGSTLLEQILATYPGIYGAGELPDFEEVIAANVRDAHHILSLSSDDFHRMGGQYAEKIWRFAPNAARVTDKMLSNFLYLGMIHLMLPNAKIIHAVRDPMDSCFSCYSRLFVRDNIAFSYDLETLGRHYLRYTKLMEHWHAVLPAGTMLDVRYEDMVRDTEGQARRIFDFLDLPWDERCLAFHQNKRHVLTASSEQVRKPIYRSSVARWQHFSKHLDSLLHLVNQKANSLAADLPSFGWTEMYCP